MPRWVYVVAAWACAAISITLASRYGYKTADTQVDAVLSALTFGVFAALGGILQALAVHVGFHMERRVAGIFWGIVIGAVGFLAMVATMTVSIGSFASRSDASQAERAKLAALAEDDQSELARLKAERIKLDEARPIGAIKADLETARASRAFKVSSSCDPAQTVGKSMLDACKAFHGLERELALAQAAERIDRQMAEIRARRTTGPAVSSVDAQTTTLAHLLGMGQSNTAGGLHLFYAIVLELAVAATMFGVELTKPQPAPRAPEVPTTPAYRVADALTSLQIIGGRSRVDLAEVRRLYVAECRRREQEPADGDTFTDDVADYCKAHNIRLQAIDGRVFILGVRLAA